MNTTAFSFPTKIFFGAGALAELPAKLQSIHVSRPLVVTDPGLLKTEAFAGLRDALGQAAHNQNWFLFSGVHPNPVESDVLETAAAFRQNRCDGIIAFGGGSALDVGKAARLWIKRPELKLTDFRYDDDWSGLVPFAAIPTTAGTGSEVGRSSVITDPRARRKMVLFHPELLARFVILDPEVTRALPPALTAATGADALTHCLESFTSPAFHPLCDGIALEGIHLIVDALPRAFRNGNDLDARGRMLVAAAMGAVAFQKDLGATHSLAHPLSTLGGMHHGLANALCLPAVMRFNAERKPGLYRRIGLACGLEVVRGNDRDADAATIAFVEKFFNDLGLKRPLREFGIREEQIPELTEQAFHDTCHQTNPVPVTRDDLEKLYRAAL